MQEIAEVVVSAQGQGSFQGVLTLEIDYLSARFPITIPLGLAANTSVTACKFSGIEAGPELLAHLNANKLHYNQAIWRSLDTSTMALLLSKFAFEGMPVANMIDPKPLQTVGNYVVFRLPGFTARRDVVEPPEDAPNTPEGNARQVWRNWLQQRGLTFNAANVSEQLVPVSTGGVFAEAVLGRANSAEKLDATRFWNWQDSPIPLQPPEIAAINLDSRNQPTDLKPGQLGQPVLNIVNPTGLPDPTGLGAMLGAIQNGNMFRDMSGLAATIGLAQATAADATSAASDAAKQATANMNIAAQRDVALKQIAAQAKTAQAANPQALAGTPKTHSEMGAVMNTAAARDATKAASPAPNVTGGGAPVFAGSGNKSNADASFRRALWGEAGDPVNMDRGILQPFDPNDPKNQDPGIFQTPPDNTPISPDRMNQVLSAPDEMFFYAHGQRTDDLATFEQEIDALTTSQWRPASPDFRAIAIRSSGMKAIPTSNEVATVNQFLAVLARATRRFNFFGFITPEGDIPLSAEVSRNKVVTNSPSTLTALSVPVLKNSISTVAFLAQVWFRNDDYAKTLADERGPIRRQLWLYLASPTGALAPGTALNLATARALANLLEMDVIAINVTHCVPAASADDTAR